jgi:hypothetical protein
MGKTHCPARSWIAARMRLYDIRGRSCIAERHDLSEAEAVKQFYNSRLYALLEDEQTKLWHYSPLLLFTMYDEETKTGEITFPEEAA